MVELESRNIVFYAPIGAAAGGTLGGIIGNIPGFIAGVAFGWAMVSVFLFTRREELEIGMG
jgi:hypothetical protein